VTSIADVFTFLELINGSNMVFLEGNIVQIEGEYSHYIEHLAHDNENFLVASKNSLHREFVEPEYMAPSSAFHIHINCVSMEMCEKLNIVLYRNIFEAKVH